MHQKIRLKAYWSGFQAGAEICNQPLGRGKTPPSGRMFCWKAQPSDGLSWQEIIPPRRFSGQAVLLIFFLA
jgi:hypothetical protein